MMNGKNENGSFVVTHSTSLFDYVEVTTSDKIYTSIPDVILEHEGDRYVLRLSDQEMLMINDWAIVMWDREMKAFVRQ